MCGFQRDKSITNTSLDQEEGGWKIGQIPARAHGENSGNEQNENTKKIKKIKRNPELDK